MLVIFTLHKDEMQLYLRSLFARGWPSGVYALLN